MEHMHVKAELKLPAQAEKKNRHSFILKNGGFLSNLAEVKAPG